MTQNFNPTYSLSIILNSMSKLTKTQIRYLKGLCHQLNPVVTVANKGLNENVIEEIERTIDHHELIKIKIRDGDSAQRKLIATQIVDQVKATLIQKIGMTACFYKKNLKQAKLALPK